MANKTPGKSKAQRQAAMRPDLKLVQDTKPEPIIQEPETTTPPPQDPPPPAEPNPESPPESPAKPPISVAKPKKKKKYSEDALNYFEHRKKRFGMGQVITLLTAAGNCPKSRGAGERFKRYKDGMRVEQYIEDIKAHFSRSESNILDDIHWDFCKGFIAVDGQKYHG
jgi:hypothetical protein